jgi:hypothetical protein
MQGLSHHHLRVEKRSTADLSHQHAKVPIRAIEHGRHAEGVGSNGCWASNLGHGSIRTALVPWFRTDDQQFDCSVPSFIDVCCSIWCFWQSLAAENGFSGLEGQ